MALEIWAAMIGLAILAPAVWLYNRLVAERNLVRQGYADIDVQLKRRADLVPQLVEAVRGYAAHEKALLTSLVELRSAALAAPQAAERFTHESALGERLANLVLLQENYPQLKADANFPDLSARLVPDQATRQAARGMSNASAKNALTPSQNFQ